MLLRDFFRTVWAVLRKDVRTWLRQPTNIASTILPPLGLLLIEALAVAAVGRSPVALVRLDSEVKGAQMAQIIHQANVFRVTDATPQQAEALFHNLDVVAIVTIPANFTRMVEAHTPVHLEVEVNNLNLDFTNDIRRAVPDVITQFYQAQGLASPIGVTMHEQDLRSRDIELFQYSVLPTMVLLLVISGLISSSFSTAREWESRTVKELLLSPQARGAIIMGKVLAGFVTTLALGLVILGLGDVLGWVQPEDVYWLSTLLVVSLVALLSSGLGVALGALIQRIQPVMAVSISIALYLFFLAGGNAVLAFEPVVLQNIASFDPLTYGRHALEMALFYQSSDQLGRDIAVLTCSALATIGLGTMAMRRGMAH